MTSTEVDRIESTTHTAIISVDGHVKAPRVAYSDYIDPAVRSTFDEWLAGLEGTPDGYVDPAVGEDAQWDPHKRLRDLETQGVVAETLFPNGLAFGDGVRDPALIRAANMAYNRWIVDFCSAAPGRLVGQAAVSFDDIELAVRDIHWAKENGLGGVVMPGLYPGDTFFFDPALDPIWAACQETGLPVSQHGGSGTPDYQPPGFAAIMTLALEHAFYSGRSLGQFIIGGVFERFPDLRLVLVETEAWWIAPVIEHLDQRARVGDDWTEFAAFMGESGGFKRLASEYWQSNCYAGVSPFHPAQIPFESLGADAPRGPEFRVTGSNVMFGVDYPHYESIYPEVREQVVALAAADHVTPDDVDRILLRNAAEVYGFDLQALAPHVERVGFELASLSGA
jgi:predicted TIM-barrel fold metal-dependent hydrolase